MALNNTKSLFQSSQKFIPCPLSQIGMINHTTIFLYHDICNFFLSIIIESNHIHSIMWIRQKNVICVNALSIMESLPSVLPAQLAFIPSLDLTSSFVGVGTYGGLNSIIAYIFLCVFAIVMMLQYHIKVFGMFCLCHGCYYSWQYLYRCYCALQFFTSIGYTNLNRNTLCQSHYTQ